MARNPDLVEELQMYLIRKDGVWARLPPKQGQPEGGGDVVAFSSHQKSRTAVHKLYLDAPGKHDLDLCLIQFKDEDSPDFEIIETPISYRKTLAQ